MQDHFFSLFLFFFFLATGKKKIKACNLPLAGTEEISFRCLPTLMEEFCSPTLSPPPGHVISGLSAGPGGSAERCCPHPRAGQGVRGWAAVPSNANGSLFPDDNPYIAAGAAQPRRADAAGDDVSTWTINPAWHEHPWKDLMSPKKPVFLVSSGIVDFSANYCVLIHP